MAIVLEAHYAKKLGLPGYSSHQYSVSIRTELSDLSQVETESGRLYRLLQDAVDREIQEAGFIPQTAAGRKNSRSTTSRPRAAAACQHSGSAAWKCSDKQKALIQKLVSEYQLDKNEVEQLAQSMFGSGVIHLDRLQASGLIDELIRRQTRGNRNEAPINGASNGRSMRLLAGQVRSVAIPGGGGRL